VTDAGTRRRTKNLQAAEYLKRFFEELERLLPVKCYATYDHSIGRGHDGRVEIRLSAVDWYKIALTTLDPDPIKAARDAASAPTKWPDDRAG